MSKIIRCSTFHCGKAVRLLENRSSAYLIPSRGKRIPPHKAKIAGDNDRSERDPGRLTDIRYYQALDKSHLHKWDGKSPKRKFELKLEEMEKKKYFSKDSVSSTSSHPTKSDQIKSESSDHIDDISKKSDSIIIPTYIERSPSAILRALASCVGRDNTAPDYKYHDDPFLIPYNSNQKRDYILAKDSGRKAARYVLDNHPDLFTDNLIYDEPKISKYLPKVNAKGREKNIGFLNDLLLQNINSFDVLGAIETYELLEKVPLGVEKINEDTIIELLELLCYYNNEEETDSESYQLLAGLMLEDKTKTWKLDGLAERIFSEVINNSRFDKTMKDRARLAHLCAKAKFQGSKDNQSNSTLQLKDECTASNTNLNLHAYNAVLFGMPAKHRNFETGKKALIDILEEMSANKIQPDQHTLYNAMRYVYNLVSGSRENIYFVEAQKTALSLLSEFRNVGIEPSLGALEVLMKIYNKSAGLGKTHAIVFDVIEELEKRQKSGIPLQVMIPEDVDFFHLTMANINKIKNVKLAYRTHRLLLNEGENCNALLGGFLNQTFYYKWLLLTAMQGDSLDVAMELYSTIVPHVFSPNLDLYRSLLEQINLQAGHKHISTIWTDLQASNYCGAGIRAKMPISQTIAETMAEADLEVFTDCTDAENEEKRNLLKSFTLIGKEMFEEFKFLTEIRGNINQTYPSSMNEHAMPILSKVMEISIKQIDEDEVSNLSLVIEIMNYIEQEKMYMIGTLEVDVLMQIVENVIKLPLTGGKMLGLKCVHYAAENRLNGALKMANMFTKHFSNLEKTEKADLNQLFAHDTEWTNLE